MDMMKHFFSLSMALVFVAASTVAHAIKLVSGPQADPGAATTALDSITYAKETLLLTALRRSDDTLYYDIARTHYVSGPTKLYASAGDTRYVVTYSLEGMVFSEQAKAYALSRMNDVAGAISPPTAATELTTISGGSAGDAHVVFRAIDTDIRPTDGVPSRSRYRDASCPFEGPVDPFAGQVCHFGGRLWVHHEGGAEPFSARHWHSLF